MIIVLLYMLGGCYDLSNRTLPENEPAELFTDINYSDTSVSEIITKAETDANAEELYFEYPFTPEDEDFLALTVFVGDNLCLGLSSFGLVTSERIIAAENAAATNITEINLEYGGGSIDVLTALVNANPKNIVMTFGSNYQGIENTEEYCDDYISFILLAKNYCPNAEFIILAAPPVNSTSIFENNEMVRQYNTALKQAVENMNDTNISFIDIGIELKNTSGELKHNYGSGDRLLLTERGFYAVLWQICNFFNNTL